MRGSFIAPPRGPRSPPPVYGLELVSTKHTRVDAEHIHRSSDRTGPAPQSNEAASAVVPAAINDPKRFRNSRSHRINPTSTVSALHGTFPAVHRGNFSDAPSGHHVVARVRGSNLPSPLGNGRILVRNHIVIDVISIVTFIMALVDDKIHARPRPRRRLLN